MDSNKGVIDASLHWPCACVKRNSKGKMTHIKLNPPAMRVCSACKCKRPPMEVLKHLATKQATLTPEQKA
jgi:hypothetical protein